jgi:RecA/RadA recombinase
MRRTIYGIGLRGRSEKMAAKKAKKSAKKSAKKFTKRKAFKKSGAKRGGTSGSSSKKKASKSPGRKKRSKTSETASPTASKSKEGDTIDAWMRKMATDKKWRGKVQIRRASEVTSPYIYRRPTGILSLDLALAGGIHAGGVTEIQGAESSCKTFLTYMTAGEIQRTYGDDTKIMIACTEILPDVGFARQAGFCIGYDEERIDHYDEALIEQGYEPFTYEEREDLRKTIGRVYINIADTGESLLQSIVEGLDASRDDPTGGFQLVIIESMGALLPAAVEEKNVGERTFGGSAPMITQFQLKMYPRLMFDRGDGTKQLTSIIGVSQARANTDAGKYGPKTKSSTGAFAWKHAQLANIELTVGAKEKEDKIVIGKKIRWKLVKGKAGTHDGPAGEFTFYHLNRSEPVFWEDVLEADELVGIDTVSDAVAAAKKMGVVEGTTWLTWKEGKKTILKTQGLPAFATKLMDNPDLLVRLRTQCIEESGILVKYR